MLTALVVPVARVGSIVDPWREQTCNDKPSIGVPAHVTVLFPFLPAEEVEYQLLDDLRHLFAGLEPFGFTLPKTERWPTVLYLPPVPAGPFVELTRAVLERWPDCRPYEGRHEEIVPHVTVAQGEGALLDLAEADVAPKLPLTTRATEVLLLEERRPFWQEWATRERFPLGVTR